MLYEHVWVPGESGRGLELTDWLIVLHVIGQLILTFNCGHAGWDYFAWPGIRSTWYGVWPEKKSNKSTSSVTNFSDSSYFNMNWLFDHLLFKNSNIYFCMFACIHIHMCVHVQVCRGQKDADFLPQSFSTWFFFFFFWANVSHYMSLLIQTGWLAGRPQGSSCIHVPSTRDKCQLPGPCLVWVLGILAQAPTLVQALYQPSPLSSPLSS